MLRVNYLILSIIILYFGLHAQASGSITIQNITKTFLEQDVAVFNCSLDAGPTYGFTQAGLSVNGSGCVTAFSVNTMYPRINLTSTAFNAASPPAEYTISPYLLIDNVTQYSCCAPISSGVYSYTNSITLRLAAPPSAASINYTTTYVSVTNCTITLTWPAVASDRAVTGYEVLQNSTSIGTTTPMSMNSYTVPDINLLQHYATYSVNATSSAGSSIGSFIFTPLPAAPPSAPNIALFAAYAPDTSCTGTITLTWPAVTSDRDVTGYEVLQNSIVVSMLPPSADTYTAISMTSLLTYSGSYTVRAINCTGSSVSNEVLFSPLRVTAIDVTSPALAADGNLTLNLIFSANRVYAVNYTMYAITNFTNGSSDRRAIHTAVQNSATLLTLAIPLPYLVNSSTSLLLADVQNVSVMLTVHSQCGQVLTLSSGVIPVAVDFTTTTTTRITTTTTTTTTSTSIITPATTPILYTTPTPTATTTTIASTSPVSTASNVPITLFLVFIILPVLLLLLSIIVIVVLIIFILHLLRKIKYLTSKMNTNNNTIDRAHVYNYIDLNNLALTSDEQHYYSDMAPVGTNNNNTTTDGTTSNTDGTTSNRAEYINVSTTDINTKSTYANLS